MIIVGVGVGVLAVVIIGLSVARKVDGDSTNFLVAGRALPNSLVGGGFDGWATVLAAAASLVVFVRVTLARPPVAPAARAKVLVEPLPALAEVADPA